MPQTCQIKRVRCRRETRRRVQVEPILLRPFSHAKPRTGSHRSPTRNLTTERPFSLAALNPDTGSGHSRPGTYGAPLWRAKRSLRLGHARHSHRTGQQETKNARALTGNEKRFSDCEIPLKVERTSLTNDRTVTSGHCHSEPCGFLLLSSFKSGCWKRIAEPRVCSVVSLGGFLSFPVFVALCFKFGMARACALWPVRFQYSTSTNRYRLVQVQPS